MTGASGAGERAGTLLRAAAAAMDDGRDPFSTDWLVEHRVTLDECYGLAAQIAGIVRGYLVAPTHIRQIILVAGAAAAAGGDGEGVAHAAEHHLALRRLREAGE